MITNWVPPHKSIWYFSSQILTLVELVCRYYQFKLNWSKEGKIISPIITTFKFYNQLQTFTSYLYCLGIMYYDSLFFNICVFKLAVPMFHMCLEVNNESLVESKETEAPRYFSSTWWAIWFLFFILVTHLVVYVAWNYYIPYIGTLYPCFTQDFVSNWIGRIFSNVLCIIFCEYLQWLLYYLFLPHVEYSVISAHLFGDHSLTVPWYYPKLPSTQYLVLSGLLSITKPWWQSVK